MIDFFTSMLAATWSLLTVYYVPVLIFYAVGGIVYTILKWYFDVFKLRSAVLNSQRIKDAERKLEFTAIDAEKKILLSSILDEKKSLSGVSFNGYSYPPQLSSHKAQLFWRAVFWPLNLAWLLVGEIAIDFWTMIYNKTAKGFQTLSDRILP